MMPVDGLVPVIGTGRGGIEREGLPPSFGGGKKGAEAGLKPDLGGRGDELLGGIPKPFEEVTGLEPLGGWDGCAPGPIIHPTPENWSSKEDVDGLAPSNPGPSKLTLLGGGIPLWLEGPC